MQKISDQIEQATRKQDSDRQNFRSEPNHQHLSPDRQFSPINSESLLNNNELQISSQIRVIPIQKNQPLFRLGLSNISSQINLNPPESEIDKPATSKLISQIRKWEYADDEEIYPIKLDAKGSRTSYDLENNLTLEVKTRFKKQQLRQDKSQYLPGVVSVKTREIGQNQTGQCETRVGVDLICLIDKSGSMQGLKIFMVRQTLNVILNFLTAKDRLQLIIFDEVAQRLTPLKKVTDENKQYFKQVIGSISAFGGTLISSATKIAFQQLEQRRYRNNISSIFLLSDGQDPQAEKQVFQQQLNFNEFITMHTFGYGDDHNAKMMVALSNLKSGSFYFVQKIQLLDEFFVDALGGLISVVGEQLEINITCLSIEPFEEVKIRKTYGRMWKRLSNRKFEIKLPQITSGQKKDFVFELKIPKFFDEIEDSKKLVQLLEVKLKVKNAFNGQIIEKNAKLQLKFYNENDNIADNEEDIQVAAEYYRIKGTEVIENARKACSQGQHQDAQVMIDRLLIDIQSNPLLSQHASQTISDLQQAKQASTRQNYNSYGQSQMLQLASNILNQQGLNSQFSEQGVQLQPIQQGVTQNTLQYEMMLQSQQLKLSSNKIKTDNF